MKKIAYSIFSFILLLFINGCVGYEPIFGSTNLQFKIADYSIESNQRLGRQIYSKLNNLSKFSEDNLEVQSINIIINTEKDKQATAKDSTGKILGYRIVLNSNIVIKDYLTNKEILNQSFSYSATYNVQDQYSETKKLENKSTGDLLNKIYQNLIIKMSENMLTQ